MATTQQVLDESSLFKFNYLPSIWLLLAHPESRIGKTKRRITWFSLTLKHNGIFTLSKTFDTHLWFNHRNEHNAFRIFFYSCVHLHLWVASVDRMIVTTTREHKPIEKWQRCHFLISKDWMHEKHHFFNICSIYVMIYVSEVIRKGLYIMSDFWPSEMYQRET